MENSQTGVNNGKVLKGSFGLRGAQCAPCMGRGDAITGWKPVPQGKPLGRGAHPTLKGRPNHRLEACATVAPTLMGFGGRAGMKSMALPPKKAIGR